MKNNTLDINGLHIDVASLGKMYLTKVLPYYAYENKERTDRVEGYKYVVVLPMMEFSSLAVKIEGSQLMSVERGDETVVQFDNLIVKLYYDVKAGTYRLSARAEGISEV